MFEINVGPLIITLGISQSNSPLTHMTLLLRTRSPPVTINYVYFALFALAERRQLPSYLTAMFIFTMVILLAVKMKYCVIAIKVFSIIITPQQPNWHLLHSLQCQISVWAPLPSWTTAFACQWGGGPTWLEWCLRKGMSGQGCR
ncbi:hypothetical protein FGO68_gene9299 [Halteria grandinella]|uniref:Uncharacterized protein n=1 Tax=Halteria grandinella TaxID=5974 RepID=A0A8J8NRE8_HALGN|nr:hypothetical protein FGO68_gene9299 [Halteria grandinella]